MGRRSWRNTSATNYLRQGHCLLLTVSMISPRKYKTAIFDNNHIETLMMLHDKRQTQLLATNTTYCNQYRVDLKTSLHRRRDANRFTVNSRASPVFLLVLPCPPNSKSGSCSIVPKKYFASNAEFITDFTVSFFCFLLFGDLRYHTIIISSITS
jgi:hypothetical protein